MMQLDLEFVSRTINGKTHYAIVRWVSSPVEGDEAEEIVTWTLFENAFNIILSENALAATEHNLKKENELLNLIRYGNKIVKAHIDYETTRSKLIEGMV